ncbi:MAG: glycerophosphodiester phosphodiesterase [Candidatus Thorarchaeota archaeon]
MVQVIAHRGTGIGPRENTLQAFKTAISWGVDCIECDIRSSRDGVAIIIHDLSLDRFASATGKVADYSLSELKAIEIGKGERIPTLTEFFDLVAPEKDIGIDLDVKVIGMEAPIMDKLQEYDLVHRTMISSFIQPVLKEVRSLNEDIVTALLYEYDLRNPVEVAKGLGCTAINPQLHLIDSSLIAKCHREGLKINPWVINEPEEMRRFIEYGVDGIITDLPRRLLEMLNRGS